MPSRSRTLRSKVSWRVRLAASSVLQDDAEQAAREVLALYCCGPAGGGGVRWRTTQRIRTQSYLVAPDLIKSGFTLRTAQAWLA